MDAKIFFTIYISSSTQSKKPLYLSDWSRKSFEHKLFKILFDFGETCIAKYKFGVEYFTEEEVRCWIILQENQNHQTMKSDFYDFIEDFDEKKFTVYSEDSKYIGKFMFDSVNFDDDEEWDDEDIKEPGDEYD